MDEMIKKMVSKMDNEQRQHLIKELEAKESTELLELINYLKSLI